MRKQIQDTRRKSQEPRPDDHADIAAAVIFLASMILMAIWIIFEVTR